MFRIKSLLFVSLLVTTAAFAEGDPTAGKEKSAACAACHAEDGNSVNPEWPKIAGQHPKYIYKQLKDFKENKRENALMAGSVAPLNDQDMQDLAAYFSAQTSSPGAAGSEQLESGQFVYRGGNLETGLAACIACHSPTGAGNPAATFPKLSGQHSTYIASQLRNYRSGTRSNDPAEMMRMVAAKMSDQEIDAVADYIAGLH